jgi:ketosteroid isomerase-like protein
MKYLILLLLTLTIFSCNKKSSEPISDSNNGNKIDIQAELESIEQLRAGFQQAIKEKRYADLGNYGTKDIISLTPICGTWEEYKRLRNEPVGSFSYDSLIMNPKETIIVSDTIAYDFGTSSVYYTNEQGEPVEITDTFLAILKKDKTDGKWKLHREVATTNKME